MYIHMWHVYLYIYLVYIYAIHPISSPALKGISIEVNGEVTKLELTYSNYIGWIWPHEFVEHASVFFHFFLFFSPFFLSFPELFVPVSCSYAQLQEIHCWYGRTFVKIDEYCHLTMSYDNSKTWLEWQSSCPQRKDKWGADLWARRFLDDEILPMLAEAANEGLVEAQLWSSSGFICPFPGLQPSWQEHIDAGMFMNRSLGTWTLGCWEAEINCYHDSEI